MNTTTSEPQTELELPEGTLLHDEAIMDLRLDDQKVAASLKGEFFPENLEDLVEMVEHFKLFAQKQGVALKDVPFGCWTAGTDKPVCLDFEAVMAKGSKLEIRGESQAL
jgi:hypothetical protein